MKDSEAYRKLDISTSLNGLASKVNRVVVEDFGIAHANHAT